MRYFLLAFVLGVAAVIAVAGKRGDHSRRPPIEIFNDMVRQSKIRPQTPNDFFADRRSSRLPVEGTVARSVAFTNLLTAPNAGVFPYEDAPVNTGRLTGTTNWVETSPFAVTAEFLARGQQRYQISCLPCHGAQADGKGITTKLGMSVVRNLHEPQIVKLADGEIFNTISYGKNLMSGYGANIATQDRWAIIAYLRALQLSHLGTIDEVPVAQRAALK